MTLLDDLFSGDEERAEAALARLDAAHLPDLVAALDDPDSDRRWWAVRALAQFPAADATQALLRALGDPHADVRAVAVFALGERGAAEAVGPLLALLADEGPYLARLAADALARIGAAALPELIRALAEARQPAVRAGAARALAAIGDTRAIPALFKALEDESMLVQHWADEGLERMGVGQIYFKP